MIVNFSRAKRVAAGCLAMGTCAFFLWINQSAIRADQVNSGQPAGNMAAVANRSNINTVTAINQSPVDAQGQGNYACLDQEQVDNNGDLNVAGWHATNASQGRQYHYLIAYDPTNHQEISRQNITENALARPDVAQTHNVYGAAKSGFKTTFKLGDRIAGLSQVQVISRYTNDVKGNGSSVDYWFAPVTINQNNNANLDGVTTENNRLRFNGWHATNLAADKPYHYIIIVDRTAGNREVERSLIMDPVSRPDVAKVYPDVKGVMHSGFSVYFPLTDINLNHQLQVISRYSGASDGNSDYVDYWFNPITSGNKLNQGYLDGYDLSSGNQLTVTGWHLTSLASLEPYHFLILFDQTNSRQVGQTVPVVVNRPDVARAFPEFSRAVRSGFTASFALNRAHLVAGHTYVIVSRYSTSSQGNGDQGQCTDCWLAPFKLNQRGAAWLDSTKMTSNGLRVAGWLASDQSLNKPYPYVIVLNDGKEVGRSLLALTNRPDVGSRYGQVYNSQKSGFSVLIKFDPAQVNGHLRIILRFSGRSDGNGDYLDLLDQSFASNDGHFDVITVSQNNLYISGWHASDQSVGKPYQWLIFVDQNGHELYRQRVLDINNPRPDLASKRSFILGASQAGFKLGFTIPNQLHHQAVRIIHRYTDDLQGNGNFADWWSGVVGIDPWGPQLRNRWQSVVNTFRLPVSIAIQDASTGEVVNYSDVPGQTFVTASTVKVGILAKLLHDQNGNLSSYQQGVAARMIERSDNGCATELFNEIGRGNGLNQLYQELGMSSSHTDLHWALTTTTALDQLRLLHEIFLNPASSHLNRQSQQFIQSLMGQVIPSQSWGISAGSPNFYIKNGWNTTDSWNISSIGYIPGKYTIAVYAKSPSFNTGRNFIQQLALVTRQTIS